MSRSFDVAVVGAIEAVGETLLAILEERDFPVGQLYPLASEHSAGTRMHFNGKMWVVKNLEDFDFSRVQLAFFAAGAAISALHVPRAVAAGCVVIDDSSQFSGEADIPLVVPEVNPDAIAHYKNRNIIVSPNSAAVQMLVALKPIYDAVGIERINVATYQSVSGMGKKAMQALVGQTAALLNGKPVETTLYSQQIAFNALPQIDEFTDNGYTQEEMNIVRDTRKVFADDALQINPTAVCVPIFYGHSEALHIETRDKISLEQVRELMRQAPGVELMDERQEGGYPTAVTDAVGTDPVYVGRLREDLSHPRGLNLWVVADNIRKGAALNTIQIAEILIKDYI